jgi:hypothetical protein
MTISAQQHGYQVRVTRKGVCSSKFFRLKQDAQKYERELLRQLGPVESQKGKPKQSAKLPNTRTKRIVKRQSYRNGRETDVYVVYWWTPDGQPRESSVSIKLWGQQKAFERAKAIKREKDAARVAGGKRRARRKT